MAVPCSSTSSTLSKKPLEKARLGCLATTLALMDQLLL